MASYHSDFIIIYNIYAVMLGTHEKLFFVFAMVYHCFLFAYAFPCLRYYVAKQRENIMLEQE